MAKKALFLDGTGQRIAGAIEAIAGAVSKEDYLSWKQIQKYIREGTIDNYLAIGDEKTVYKATGTSLAVSTTGSLTASLAEATFFANVPSIRPGEYVFYFDGNVWKNTELGGSTAIIMSYYGITTGGTASAGDTITITVTCDVLVFQYVAKDKCSLRNSELTHSGTFQLKHVYRTFQFDAPEAIICASSAMPAGTYHFNLYKPSNIYYLNSGLQNKDVQFTTTVEIPAGGQLVVTTGDFRNSTAVSDLKLTSYAKGSTTALESNIACSEGTSGTDLGNANTAANSAKLNSTDRCMYGSNKWTESALRLWLNTNKPANSWWSAQGNFDRPSTNVGVASWMYGLQNDFLEVIQEAATPTTQNWFDGGTTVTSYDKFFVPSNSQVYFTATTTEGDNWDYYVIFSDLGSAGTGADSNRIKLGSNGAGSAAYWWTRTPYSDYSHLEYTVYPSGAWDYTSAHSSYGVAPACCVA